MSPDRRGRRKAPTPMSKAPEVRTGPSSDDAHAIVFFRRHKDDDPEQRAPGREALNSYPAGVRSKMRAALVAVATAPPKRFAGGGRIPVAYYLTAMLFILFDIEMVFLYPFAVNIDALGLFGLVEIVLFVATVAFAYAYVWRRGGLDWS